MKPPADDLTDLIRNGIYLFTIRETNYYGATIWRTLVGYQIVDVVWQAPLALVLRRKLEQPEVVLWEEVVRMVPIVSEVKK